MQLYKSRTFGAYFQDTFGFIKSNGGHFFKHFFIINGIFILMLMVLGYFFMQFYTDVLFGGISQNNPNVFDEMINENMGWFIFLFILFLVASILFGVMMYAYPIFYLDLYHKLGRKAFGTAELVTAYKQNLLKLFIFILAGILIGIPIIMVMGAVVFVLFITIIGILLLPFVIATFALFYSLTLFEYIQGKRSIWDSFGYSWKLMSSKLIPVIGCVGLFYIMSYLVQNVITLIGYLFGVLRMFTTVDSGNPNPEEMSASFSVIMIIMFLASFVLGAILNNILVLNQGVIFYSLKEETENIHAKSIIDQIGSGE